MVCYSFLCNKPLESVEDKYPDGTLHFKYFRNKDKQKQGQWIEFFPNGQIKSKLSFHKDLEEGRAVYFYETGELKEVQYFTKGKKNGPDTVFSQVGTIRNISNFKNGLKHGKFLKFKLSSDSLDIESNYSQDSLISFKKYE